MSYSFCSLPLNVFTVLASIIIIINLLSKLIQMLTTRSVKKYRHEVKAKDLASKAKDLTSKAKDITGK